MIIFHAISFFSILVYFTAFGSAMFDREIRLFTGILIAGVTYLAFLPMISSVFLRSIYAPAAAAMKELGAENTTAKTMSRRLLLTAIWRGLAATLVVTIVATYILAARRVLRYSSPEIEHFVMMGSLVALLAVVLFVSAGQFAKQLD